MNPNPDSKPGDLYLVLDLPLVCISNLQHLPCQTTRMKRQYQAMTRTRKQRWPLKCVPAPWKPPLRHRYMQNTAVTVARFFFALCMMINLWLYTCTRVTKLLYFRRAHTHIYVHTQLDDEGNASTPAAAAGLLVASVVVCGNLVYWTHTLSTPASHQYQ